MPVTLAYSSATGQRGRAHVWGWDAFDQRVLHAVQQAPGATFDDVVHLLPPGIHLRLISEALRGLAAGGLLQRGRTIADGQITATYTAATAADTRKAA